MTSRSRSQNSSLRLVQHFHASTKRKLSNAKQTAEPDGITQAKTILKCTKNVTTSFEQIAEDLYFSQIETSQILCSLSNQLNNIHIQDSSDRFAVFLNNIGKIHRNMQELRELNLVNMKSSLIDPLHAFNTTEIEKCQSNKLQLKTLKAQYDVKRHNHIKINQLLNERFPEKRHSNSSSSDGLNEAPAPKMKNSKSSAEIKSEQLQNARTEFLNSTIQMMGKRMQLMQKSKDWMASFEAYSSIHCANIEKEQKNMFGTVCNCDWSKTVLLKEGYFKIQGIRRYFKLFKNKKLVHMSGNGGNGTAMIKGYIDLNKILDISKRNKYSIEIQTMAKMYLFQFLISDDRDQWFDIMQQSVANKKVSILQMKHSFEKMNEQKEVNEQMRDYH